MPKCSQKIPTLRHTVVLQRLDPNAMPNENNETIADQFDDTGWTDYATMRAAIEQASAREVNRNTQLSVNAKYKITTRYHPATTERDRIKFVENGVVRYFNIAGREVPGEIRQWQTLWADEKR